MGYSNAVLTTFRFYLDVNEFQIKELISIQLNKNIIVLTIDRLWIVEGELHVEDMYFLYNYNP